MKHLLDTSALCAHFLHEPGGDQVSALFSENPTQLAVCVITWFEMRGALERCGVASHLVDQALALYRELPLSSLSVTEPVVDRAVQLRGAASRRLPLADALIAGCAAVHGMVLVHRDAHFDALPADIVKQRHLQDSPTDATSEDVPPRVRESPPAYPARRARKKNAPNAPESGEEWIRDLVRRGVLTEPREPLRRGQSTRLPPIRLKGDVDVVAAVIADREDRV